MEAITAEKVVNPPSRPGPRPARSQRGTTGHSRETNTARRNEPDDIDQESVQGKLAVAVRDERVELEPKRRYRRRRRGKPRSARPYVVWSFSALDYLDFVGVEFRPALRSCAVRVGAFPAAMFSAVFLAARQSSSCGRSLRRGIRRSQRAAAGSRSPTRAAAATRRGTGRMRFTASVLAGQRARPATVDEFGRVEQPRHERDDDAVHEHELVADAPTLVVVQERLPPVADDEQRRVDRHDLGAVLLAPAT